MNLYFIMKWFELKYIYPKYKEEYERIGLQIENRKPVFLFPCWYTDPGNDDERKEDMMNILKIVDRYRSDKRVNDSLKEEKEFPFDAYIWIIQDYIENWYYTEKEIEYTKNWNWKIDWKKTIKNNKIYQWINDIVYSELIKKKTSFNTDNIITQIHKICVNEAIEKMWWYFWIRKIAAEITLSIPKSTMIWILQSEYSKSFTDYKKTLIINMIKLLEGLDNNFQNSTRFDISTKDFEDVFERLLRREFWTEDESNFNPKANYYLLQDDWSYKERQAWELLPDVIMKHNNDIFVIDAKYYSYWYNNIFWTLPATSSIHKQITYAEDIDIKLKYDNIYNLFILPYNNKDCYLKYVWYATTTWKNNNKIYEKVHVVLIDLRDLINQKYSKIAITNLVQLLSDKI